MIKRIGYWFLLFIFYLAACSNDSQNGSDDGDGGWGDGGANAPANVTVFQATPGYEEITLAWTMPSDPNFVGVKIQRKTNDYPSGPEDGDEVYKGEGSAFTDKGLQPETHYFYKAFSYNQKLVYSSGVGASAYSLGPRYPQNVANFRATPGRGQIALNWETPADSNFTGVKIQRKMKGYPLGPADGEEVYKGNGVTYVNTPLARGTYFYTAYSYDAVLTPGPNYSNGTACWASIFSNETVDGPKSFANFSRRAIALDSNNQPFVAYGGSALYLGYFDSGVWTVETLDSRDKVGGYASMAVDQADNNATHIIYLNGSDALLYATNRTGLWTTIPIETGGGTSLNSIAVDSNHFVHIIHDGVHTGYRWINYASNKTGEWINEPVDGIGHGSQGISLGLDSSGLAHIAFGTHHSFNTQTVSTLKYATNKEGIWQIFYVDPEWHPPYVYGGYYASLAIDSADEVYISSQNYEFNDDEVASYLKYSKQNNSSWAAANLFNGTVQYTSLAIDKTDADRKHIVFYNGSGCGGLYYLKSSGDNWNSPIILDPDANSGTHACIAVDSDHNFHVSYYNAFGPGYLKYATGNSENWTLSTLDYQNADFQGFTAMALDKNQPDKVHISYFDYSHGELKYATNNGGVWRTSTIDQGLGPNQVGHTSIALDNNNKVHISYYDPANERLKYATNKTGLWVKETIDSEDKAGYYNAIAISADDPANMVHISYYNSNARQLKYVSSSEAGWGSPQALDTEGDVGKYVSMAADSGQVHVSYFDAANRKLKYRHYTGTTWEAAVFIDDSDLGADGGFTAISLDKNQKVHISYYDANTTQLKYATNVSETWQSYLTMDSSTGVGKYSSIGVDSAGYIHISYYDGGSQNLKYASNISGAWYSYPVDSSANSGKYGALRVDGNDKVHISYYNGGGYMKYMTNID